jgi:tRNA (cmo5U34)-methyltransferase
MVSKFKKVLAENSGSVPIDVRLENIQDTRIENASVVVLNFTLQFLDRDQRQALINKIAAGLRDGGALIVSEKVCFEDGQEQADQTVWHHDFKRAQGYSDLEIAQKRNALEDVLRPETEASHFIRMQQAGLSNPRRWFQCFSFASYIAFK